LIGLGGGKNTSPFTGKKFLNGDDQVFFFVEQVMSGSRDQLKSPYGPITALLDETYAESHAWLSPFVMHPAEFQAVASSLVKNSSKVSDRKILKNLHRLDFTFSDYKELRQQLMIRFLVDTADENPELYRKLIQSVDFDPGGNKRRKDATDEMENLFNRILSSSNEGLTFSIAPTEWRSGSVVGFEGKVPVAVPRDKVEIHQ
jgi:hypothetical protein